jgi:hypothetical protein
VKRSAFSPIQTALLAFAAVALAGCAQVWLTLTPNTEATPTLTPTPISALPPLVMDTAIPAPTPTLAPSPTPQLARLEFTDQPAQFWTDPNDISELLCASGQVWAVTSGGVVCWQADTGAYQYYTTREGLASQAVQGIAQDGQGHIWVGYAQVDALSEWDGRAWITYPSRRAAAEARLQAMRAARQPDPRLWSHSEESGWIWLSTADGRVQAYDGETWRVYGSAQNVARDTWLVQASAGRVWAVGQGFSTVEEGYRVWEEHDLYSGVPAGGHVSDATLEPDGRLLLAYVGTLRLKGGLVAYDQSLGRWTGTDFTLVPALPRHVYDLAFEADGRLWAYGDAGIAVRSTDGHWERWSEMSAQCGARDAAGQLWAGTAHGLYALDASGQPTRGPWLIASPLLGNQVTSVDADAAGRLWVGTSRGLSSIDSAGRTRIALDVGVVCAARAPSEAGGELWLGTQQGLFRVNGEAEGEAPTITREREESISAVTVSASGAVYACTSQGSLYRGPQWEHVADAAAVTGASVCALAVGSDGTIWLGSANGLGEIKPDGTTALHTEKDELLNRDVRALTIGPDDTLWIATANGLARHTSAERWTRFTVESTGGGLRSKDLRALALDGEGNLWIATLAGVSLRTPATDWFYYDLPTAQCVWPSAGDLFWVGTRGGLYRLKRELFIPVP